MDLRTDCRYMLWDKPCRMHKEKGVECSSCGYFEPKGINILIIKFDAKGDVLRTTSILKGLKKRYPASFITWITSPGAGELLLHNPYIDRVVFDYLDIICMIKQEKFDLVLNPDTSIRNACLCSGFTSKEKLGYIYENNKVIPANKEAGYWYNLGMDDKLKKRNKKTYQNILLEMFRLPEGEDDIILNLTDEEILFAEEFSRKNKLSRNIPTIGLNTGAGKRWQFKSWPLEYTLELIRLINKNIKANILLFGGPDEEDRNRIILSKTKGKIIDTGTGNSLREFMALVNLCGLLVVSDSLVLHVASGLSKKVIALFGPTSSAEIDMYNRGTKLFTPLDCRCCYKNTCGINPNCMDTIKADLVLKCIQKLL